MREDQRPKTQAHDLTLWGEFWIAVILGVNLLMWFIGIIFVVHRFISWAR